MRQTVRRCSAIFVALAVSIALLVACKGAPTPYAETLAPTETPASTDTPRETATAEETPSPEPSPTPEITPSPSPTETPSPTPKATEEPYSLPYWIYVEKGSYTITVYGRDSKGGYTKVVKTFITAIGHGANVTPKGVFHILSKKRWFQFNSSRHSWTQYCMEYYVGKWPMYIHAPYYVEKDVNTLRPGDYGDIGTKVTDGCLMVNTDAAKWIYDHCDVGTAVEIVNGNPRGTQATPPPSLPPGQTYDPTDPDAPVPTAPPSPTASPSPTPTASASDEPSASPTGEE